MASARLHLAIVLVATLFAAACAAPVLPTSTAPPSATPTTEPTATLEPQPAESPLPSASPEPTIAPSPTSAPCPIATLLTVDELVAADPACFGSSSIRVKGWLDTPPPLGFLPPLVKPEWLRYPVDGFSSLYGAVPTDDDHLECGAALCAWFFPHVKPKSGVALMPHHRWVILTGHFDDPAAAGCHYVYPPDWTDGPQDETELVQLCREQFVVTAIRNTTAP